MKITDIKQVGKGMRYKVYIDDAFVGTLEAEILARYKLKTGQELSQEKFDEIKIVNADYACFDLALLSLGHGMKTEKMLIELLTKKGYPLEAVRKAVKKVKAYGYIDDAVFAENYITTYCSSKGRRRLRGELLQKGVPASIVDNKLEVIDEEQTREVARNLAQKYMKNREFDEKNELKLFRHLISKGFDYNTVANTVRGLKDDRHRS